MKTKNDLIWSISLMVIEIATFVLVGSNIIGLTLPDVVVCIIGIIDLIALPFLIYQFPRNNRKNHRVAKEKWDKRAFFDSLGFCRKSAKNNSR